MASKNDLNVSNTVIVDEPALATEDIALPIGNPDLPIVESSSPNGYIASANGDSFLSNDNNALAMGHSATTNVVHSSTNGGSAAKNGARSVTNGGSVASNGQSATANGVRIPTNGDLLQSNGDSVKPIGHSVPTNGAPITSNEEDFIIRQEIVHDRAVQVLLQNWPVSEKVRQQFEKEKIDYNQLASLCEEDLELLGVEDEKTQSEMVVTFSQLLNQNDKKYKA